MNTITGKVLRIGQTVEIPTKTGNVFKKREIVLDATRYDPYTGEPGISNKPAVEFTGERCAELDKFREGQLVTISFDLSGNDFLDKEGNTRNITRARGFRIEERQSYQAKEDYASEENPLLKPQPVKPLKSEHDFPDDLPF